MSSNTETEEEHSDDDLSEDERKSMQEAYLAEGCGHAREKIRTVRAFWSKVWPALEQKGWKKIEDNTKVEGSTLFVPEGVNIETSKKGKDYYDKIKQVLDRINERRNPAEASIAGAFRRELSRPEKSISPKTSLPRTQRPRRKTRSEPSDALDLSWKAGSKAFPLKSSRVGDNYQVSAFPEAGSWEKGDHEGSEHYCEKVWDPTDAAKSSYGLTVLMDMLDVVPHNKKEAAVLLLAERKYEVDGFSEALQDIEPTDGSNWSEEKKKQFFYEIFRLRKDFKELRKILDVPMKTCLTYYLGTFKPSDDYRIVKTVCEEKRLELLDAKQHDVDSCAVCGDGGNLLICDGCEGEYHMECMKPALAVVPEGSWFCDDCVDRKFLGICEGFVRRPSLFERKSIKRVKIDDNSRVIEKIGYWPTEEVLESVRMFSSCVSRALSKDFDPAKGQ